MTKRTKIITAFAIGTLVAGGILAIKKKEKEMSEIPIMRSYEVVAPTLTVKTSDVRLTLPYLATIKSDKSVLLSSRIAARIDQIAACGSHIQKGDVIVSLDQRDLNDKKSTLLLEINSTQSTLDAKKTTLETALASHKRTSDLLKVKGASREMYDKEKSAIEDLHAAISTLKNKISILQTNLSQIQTAMSYAVLKAPHDGTISKCFINVGDMAMPGKPLIRLESRQGKYLLIRSADSVRVSALIYNHKKLPLLDLKNTFNGLREYRADIETGRPDDERVSVSLVTYDGKGIKLPLDALLQKEGKNYCFILHEGKSEVREVHIVARGVEGVVAEGLKDKEQVVVAKPDILLQILAGKPVISHNK